MISATQIYHNLAACHMSVTVICALDSRSRTDCDVIASTFWLKASSTDLKHDDDAMTMMRFHS